MELILDFLIPLEDCPHDLKASQYLHRVDFHKKLKNYRLFNNFYSLGASLKSPFW